VQFGLLGCPPSSTALQLGEGSRAALERLRTFAVLFMGLLQGESSCHEHHQALHFHRSFEAITEMFLLFRYCVAFRSYLDVGQRQIGSRAYPQTWHY